MTNVILNITIGTHERNFGERNPCCGRCEVFIGFLEELFRSYS